MLNKDPDKMELYKINLIPPVAVSVCDGAVGYNHLDTHKVILSSGVWHVKDGPFGAPHNEYLAYLLGRELDLPVPETVVYMVEEDIKYKYNTRLLRGRTIHSAQRYILAELGKYFDYSSLSEDKLEKLIRQIARMDIFDYLTGNNDRHDKNFMISEEGKLFLIDNGWGGIGNEKIELHCNHCIPDLIYRNHSYPDESISYQKKLPALLTENKLKEIALSMEDFDWKRLNCHYNASYKICLPPERKTIKEFCEILLGRIRELSDKPLLPYPLNKN